MFASVLVSYRLYAHGVGVRMCFTQLIIKFLNY